MADDAWQTFLTSALGGSTPLIGNARCTVDTIALAGDPVPLVRNCGRTADTSWIVSLRNAFGPYARAEARAAKLSPLTRGLGVAASHFAEGLLTAGGFSGGCYLDSWLVATDLHASGLTSEAVLSATEAAAQRFPDEPIVLRSLTPPLHGALIDDLARAGFELLPTRQVWLVASPASGAWRRHRDAARDLRFAAETADRWTRVAGCDFNAQDLAEAHALYQQLYRRRYPRFNPDYTPEFLRRGVESGFLELTGWRPAEGGPLRAFVGMIHRDGVSATPLLGYDLAAPQELGLYRLASLHVWETAERLGTVLHCSAGAGAFKASRGAEPHVEYAAVWTRHLPPPRRASFASFAGALRRWAAPYLEQHRL